MNVKQQEWIGKDMVVVKSANASLVGLSGVVVDESQELIIIQTGNGVRKMQKINNVFTIDGQEVAGAEVRAAPQERLKLKVI